EHGVNILDIEQQVVHGQFLMDMLVDLAEMDLSLDQLIPGLLELGGTLGMEVRVVLHDQRRRKRVAALVSRERHCLDQLVEDWQAGRFRGDLVCVLSNHPDLAPLAEEAGLPFAWLSAEDKPAHFQWLGEQLASHAPDL